MHRTDAPDNASNLFTDGNPLVPTPATVIDDDWLNAVQEELCNAVVINGDALVKGTNTQLRKLLGAMIAGMPPGGRLTADSSNPVGDASSVGTIYYMAYRHNRIQVFNGLIWETRAFGTLSNVLTDATTNPAATTSAKNYDLFVWNNAGTLVLSRGPAWTSDAARGSGAGTTELVRQDGRYLNAQAITNGPAAARGTYVGTMRSQAANTTSDNFSTRYLWNTYNRVSRSMLRIETTANWAYTSSTARVANGGTSTNVVNFVLGLANEEAVVARVFAGASNTSANVFFGGGVGLDSTTTIAAGSIGPAAFSQVANTRLNFYSEWRGYPGIGFHTLYWLEFSQASGTTTWNGNSETGIIGEVWA